MKISRRWGIGVAVAIGLGILFAATRKPKTPVSKYVTQAIERGEVVGRVTATGTLSALVTVQVGSQVSGRIQSLFADFNSSVTKGQILAKIDPAFYETNVAQARAAQSSAQANALKARALAQDAERKMKRTEELWKEKLVAQADYDSAVATAEAAKSDLASAEAGILQANANRAQAEVNLAYTNIRSPVDGVVISRAVDVGQTVAASLQAPTVFTIAENLKRMQVDTNVAEADIGKLAEGMEASFTVDAYQNRTFKGKIRQIRFAPLTVSNVVTYDAVIDVDNSDLALRPGMTANVTFAYARADDVLRVPNAALRFRMNPDKSAQTRDRADGGGRRPPGASRGDGGEAETPRRSIWVLRNDKPERVAIRTGATDGTASALLEGDLHEGDLVIVDSVDTAGGSAPSGGGPPGGSRRLF